MHALKCSETLIKAKTFRTQQTSKRYSNFFVSNIHQAQYKLNNIHSIECRTIERMLNELQSDSCLIAMVTVIVGYGPVKFASATRTSGVNYDSKSDNIQCLFVKSNKMNMQSMVCFSKYSTSTKN